MANPRFFRRSGPFTLGSIARHVGASLSNTDCAKLLIHDLATLDAAGANDLSLFNESAYREAAALSRAGAMITTPKLGALVPSGVCRVYVANPRLAFARVGHLFYP